MLFNDNEIILQNKKSELLKSINSLEDSINNKIKKNSINDLLLDNDKEQKNKEFEELKNELNLIIKDIDKIIDNITL